MAACPSVLSARKRMKQSVRHRALIGTSAASWFRSSLRRRRESTQRLRRFIAVMGDVPSGLPHPDGTQRIHNASRELSAARKEVMKAHTRLNEFFGRGIIPEDLKRQRRLTPKPEVKGGLLSPSSVSSSCVRWIWKPAPSASCDGLRDLNILQEHHEIPAIRANIDHSHVVRTRPAGDLDHGACGNSHSDSLVIDRADAHGVGFQSKAFASQHLG